jgi:porin
MRLKRLCRDLAILGALACPTAEAFAQTVTNQKTGDSTLLAPPAAPANSPNSQYLFNAAPLGADLGKSLASYGVYINGRTFNNVVSQPSGGLKQGIFYDGFTLLGVDLDMNRIAGIHGGSMHVYINDMNGLNYFPYSGALYPFNRVWSYNAASRLNEFSYEQTLFNDRLDVRVGRLPPGPEFDFSSTYCRIVTGFCAVPAPYAYSKGYPAYNTASWAGVAQFKITRDYYVNAGVYENEPALATVNHYGWPGEDWGFDKARGAVFPVQFGYRTTYQNDLYPKSYDIGFFYNTGDYTDPLYNNHGQLLAFSGGAPQLDHGNSGIWLQGEQVIWRPDPTNDRGLSLFGGVNLATTGLNNIRDTFSGGLSVKGLFDFRPQDTINLAAMYMGLSQEFVNAQNFKLQARNIRGQVANSESFVEVNYQLALAPGTYFQPFFDYIWNPDQVGLAVPNPTVKHASYIGAAISIAFPEALGLPRLPHFGS